MRIAAYLKDPKIAVLIALVVLLAVLDALYGGPHILHLGVEFIGGTQIPVRLEHSVDPATMSTLISILQERLTTFGLKQVTVEGIGNSEVYVIIPTVSSVEINNMISIIQSQGVFQGIVNGREALNGSSLISGGIGAAQPISVNGNVTWSVDFFITQQAATTFAKVVFGQANKPLYMFLDRPSNAIVLMNSSLLRTAGSSLIGSNQNAQLQALQEVSELGNQTILIEMYNPDLSNANSIVAFFSLNRGKYGSIILAKNTPASLVANISQFNYTIRYTSIQNMTPSLNNAFTGTAQQEIVDSWPAIGLLSSPILSPGVTNGSIGQSYQISGLAPLSLPVQARMSYAVNQTNKIVSILRGGALPVHVIVGQPTTIPPTLGQHFELISVFALVIAIFAVSATIGIRYKKASLIVPIIFTTLAELFIILSIIGLVGTIDLAAVTGMIAVVGTGVDDQIIITDEVLSGASEHNIKLHLGNAFFVIWVGAALVIVSMLPLLFSTSLVTIIGFAESTILGVIFDAFITRPAYGSIISKYYLK